MLGVSPGCIKNLSAKVWRFKKLCKWGSRRSEVEAASKKNRSVKKEWQNLTNVYIYRFSLGNRNVKISAVLGREFFFDFFDRRKAM